MLTEAQAIKECQELWAEIAKSGLSKFDFFDSERGRKWRAKQYQDDCPLCQYVEENSGEEDEGCDNCPLLRQFQKECWKLRYGKDPQEFNSRVQKLSIPKGNKSEGGYPSPPQPE